MRAGISTSEGKGLHAIVYRWSGETSKGQRLEGRSELIKKVAGLAQVRAAESKARYPDLVVPCRDWLGKRVHGCSQAPSGLTGRSSTADYLTIVKLGGLSS